MAATIRSGLPIRNGVPSMVRRSGLSSQPHARTRPRRPEHRGDEGQRVDADVDQDADVEERRRGRVPRLDAAPVDLGVDGPDGPEAAAPDRAAVAVCCASPRNVDGEQPEPKAARRREVDELARLARAERQRLLAVDVLAGLEGALRDLVVSVMDGQVDDDVDLVVGEQVVERGVGPAAVRRRRTPPRARDRGPWRRPAGSPDG